MTSVKCTLTVIKALSIRYYRNVSKGIFPCSNFPRVFYQVLKFSNVQFLKQLDPLVFSSRCYKPPLQRVTLYRKVVTWEVVTWEVVTWEVVTWEVVTWEVVTWEVATWENVTWEVVVGKIPFGKYLTTAN